ncbi:MAG: hypothetical protein ACI4V5_05160 [Prevotella sp.]
MKTTTIVEGNVDGLNLILEVSEKFCEGRYLNAVHGTSMSKEDIIRLINSLKINKARFDNELYALELFAIKFPDSYATDNNKCFQTAKKVLWKIRSSVSQTKKIYKAFYKTIRKPIPNVERCSVFKYSKLSNNCYTKDLFGIKSYDECVAELYELLKQFYRNLITGLCICRLMIYIENENRNSPTEMKRIYDESVEKITKDAKEIIDIYNDLDMEVPIDELSKKMENTDDTAKLIAGYYHKLNKKEFKYHRAYQMQKKSKETGVTTLEYTLWPYQQNRIEVFRRMAKHYDDISPTTRCGTLNSKELAVFMSYTGIKPNDNKTTYFRQWLVCNYEGQYNVPDNSNLNKAKNLVNGTKTGKEPYDSKAFVKRLEDLANQYDCSSEDIYNNSSVTY